MKKIVLGIFVVSAIAFLLLFCWELLSLASGGNIPFFRPASVSSATTAFLGFLLSTFFLERNVDKWIG